MVDGLHEQSMLGMVRGIFSGKLKWFLVMITIVKGFIFAGLIYCTIQFFSTDVTNELIQWSLAILILGLMMSMLKLFAWMQMDKNALMREIKRLELLISSLSHK